jgi:hypothetical protein
MESVRTYTAFAGVRQLASADLKTVLLQTKAYLDQGGNESKDLVLIFEDATGKQVDFDFRGTPEEVMQRAGEMEGTEAPRTGPGRPKLGVVAREVTLLPRHWEWLESQPNGISAALRRLVDEARKREPGKQRARQVRDAVSRFLWVMAGNLPDFEEASRALFAADRDHLEALTQAWPEDIRSYLLRRVLEAERLETADPPSSPETASLEG